VLNGVFGGGAWGGGGGLKVGVYAEKEGGRFSKTTNK